MTVAPAFLDQSQILTERLSHWPAAIRPARSGMALLIVLVLIMMAALGAYGFAFYMESQYRLNRIHEDQVHARLAALSGAEWVAAILQQPRQQRAALGQLTNNVELFRDIQVELPAEPNVQVDRGSYWRASVVAPRLSTAPGDGPAASASADSVAELSSLAFGLENESAKIHLPTLLSWDNLQPGHARQVLLSLPGATPPIVDSWLESLGVRGSAGQVTGPGGQGASPLLGSATAPLSASHLEALNQRRLLWIGRDFNQNYRIDPLDLALGSIRPPGLIPSTGTAEPTEIGSATNPLTSAVDMTVGGLAWQRYLTWHSGARLVNSAGRPRVQLNQSDLRQLHRQLLQIWPADWADFVVAYRQYGGPPAGSLSAAAVTDGLTTAGGVDFSVPAAFFLRSPLDLVATLVNLPPQSGSRSGNSSNRVLLSPFRDENLTPRDYLGTLLDDATCDLGTYCEGRIDISSASLVVLMAVPGMDRQLADRIVQQRGSRTDSAARDGERGDTIAWLAEEGLVDISRLVTLEPYLTAHSDVYSCQVIGYRDEASPVYRLSCTWDARQRPAIMRNVQSWHSWDRGFSVASLSGETTPSAVP